MNTTQPAQKEIENTHDRLLVIDDEENMRHMLTFLLTGAGYRVESASDGKEALKKVTRVHYDYILCDLKMPDMDGLAFLRAAKAHMGETTIIMMSAFGTIDTAIEAMNLGAYDYISKPFKTDEVLLTLKKAQERESLKRENLRLKAHIQKIEDAYTFGNMVAKSKPMQDVFTLAEKAAQYNTTVLIVGESGTGKELVARGIHSSGERSAQPFVAINCGGIPENLLESELFGYKKGAFTGADRNKKGLFEEADGGTIFLDEIGELPLSLQVKLLRTLQENEIRPIGSAEIKWINVRVVAATSKQLKDEVDRGMFREDLFYRLNVMPILLPPLRQRSEDIPLLCSHIIDKLNIHLGRHVSGISPTAMSRLMDYPWLGNVRELENVIERAVVLSDDPILELENIILDRDAEAGTEASEDIMAGYSLKAARRKLERRIIIKALKRTAGNRTQAAKLLEISHPSLLSKMKEYDIDL